jgi:hypothetical protein
MSIFNKIIAVVILPLISISEPAAQYNYKVIVDNNQIWREELPNTSKLRCDGIWSIPGNSSGNKGRDIPLAEWRVGYAGIDSTWVCTEDYWKNFPSKNYDLTRDITGSNAIKFVCGYAEPTLETDGHSTTVIRPEVIDDLYTYSGKSIVVLSRAYTGAWKTEVDAALLNSKVGGVCYEQKPDVSKYQQWQLISGIRAVLAKQKKVFLLLPPNFTSVSTNYTADISAVFGFLKVNAPEILTDSNLVFVPNCYNRLKDKNTGFYGEDDSVEGAVSFLLNERQKINTKIVDKMANAEIAIYPSVIKRFVTLTVKEKKYNRMVIYNSVGSIVFTSELNNSDVFDLAHLPKGVYILTVLSDNKSVFSQKILKIV